MKYIYCSQEQCIKWSFPCILGLSELILVIPPFLAMIDPKNQIKSHHSFLQPETHEGKMAGGFCKMFCGA